MCDNIAVTVGNLFDTLEKPCGISSGVRSLSEELEPRSLGLHLCDPVLDFGLDSHRNKFQAIGRFLCSFVARNFYFYLISYIYIFFFSQNTIYSRYLTLFYLNVRGDNFPCE